ncbi:MAG: hypothetical protein CM1200mP14_00970 [Gammaproteobacteria bacterium]|nr:MAG: hypothetical protein CM1200mP14_00970 [Gammaproteobacteria bacterium]
MRALDLFQELVPNPPCNILKCRHTGVMTWFDRAARESLARSLLLQQKCDLASYPSRTKVGKRNALQKQALT